MVDIKEGDTSISEETPFTPVINRLEQLNGELEGQVVTVLPADSELGLPKAVIIPDQIEADEEELKAIKGRVGNADSFRRGFIVTTEQGVFLDRSPLMLNHLSRNIGWASSWHEVIDPDPLEEGEEREQAFQERLGHARIYNNPNKLPHGYIPDGVPFVRQATKEEFRRAVDSAKSIVDTPLIYKVPAVQPQEYLEQI